MGAAIDVAGVSDMGPVQVAFQTGREFWDAYGQGQSWEEAHSAPAPGGPVQRIPFYSPCFMGSETMFSISHEGRLLAAACLTTMGLADGTVGLAYISVDPDFRGRGFASALAKAVVESVAGQRAMGISRLDLSGYSDSGLERLRPCLHRYAGEAGVQLKDAAAVTYRDRGG